MTNLGEEVSKFLFKLETADRYKKETIKKEENWRCDFIFSSERWELVHFQSVAPSAFSPHC